MLGMSVTDVTAARAATTTGLNTPSGYRAGIVGTGFMGGVHAHAVRVSGGEVIAVAAGSERSAREAAPGMHAGRAVAAVHELIEADDVDVVHVCTPNHLHQQITLAAIAAGKHVVCEKPLAVRAADAAAMVEAATHAGVIGTVPFVYRFHPMIREARRKVRSGEIGTVHLMHGSYLQDWLSKPSDDNWRVDPESGGASRAFADIGSHWCDLLEFVTGDLIGALSARTSTVNLQRGEHTEAAVATEDLVTLQFETIAGVLGTATISQVSPGRKNRLFLEVSGAEASLAFDQEEPEKLWQGGRTGSKLLVRDPETLSTESARYARIPAGHAQGYQDCFNNFVIDTATAVAGDAPDGLPTFADGLRGAQIAEAVLASADSRTWVEVPR